MISHYCVTAVLYVWHCTSTCPARRSPIHYKGKVCWCTQCEMRVLLMEMLCFNSYNMHRVRNGVSVVLAYSSTSKGRASVDPV